MKTGDPEVARKYIHLVITASPQTTLASQTD